MKHLRTRLLPLLAALVIGHSSLVIPPLVGQTLPTPTATTVTVTPATGVLRTPANFWTANQAAISSTVTPPWSAITSKPTTVAGFGITDAKLNLDVASIAALKALPVTAINDGAVAIVRGRFFAGDGLGGFYQWSSGASYPDNTSTTNTVVVPASGGGNWQLVGALSPDDLLRRPRQLKAYQKVQAIRKGVVAQLRVMAFGDSVAQRQIGKLLPLVRKHLGLSGYIGNGAIAIALSGGATSGDDYTVSPVGTATSLPAGGAALLSQSGGSFYADTLTLYYVREPGAGTFKIQTSTNGAAFADEVGFTSIDASHGSKALGIVKISKPLDLYRMQVVGLTGTVRFIFGGFEALTIPGVVTIGLDRGGVALSGMNSVEPQIAAALYADLNPDVGWFEMKEPIPGFEAALDTHGARWASACPSMDWLYVITPPVSVSESAMAEQNAIMTNWALRRGYQVIDSYGDAGSFSVLNSTPADLPKVVSSITRVGSTATATSTAHSLAGVDGNTAGWVVIAGADQSEYNGLVFATVTGPNTFTYQVSGSPTSPATGSMTVVPTYGGDGTHLHSHAYEYLASITATRVPWLINALSVWKDDPVQGLDPLAIRTPIGPGRVALSGGRNFIGNPTLGQAQGGPSNFSHWQFGTLDGAPTGQMALWLRSWAGSAQNFSTFRFRSTAIGGGQNALALGYNFTVAPAGSETFSENITFAPSAIHLGQRAITNAESGLHIRGDNVNTSRNALTIYKGGDGTTVLFRVGNSGDDLTLGANGTNLRRLRHGTTTLVDGVAVISETTVSANSRIMLTSQVDGGTPGWLRVSARTAGNSFTVSSSSPADTSTVAWVMLEP